MDKTEFVYIFLCRSYNMIDGGGSALRGNPVIFFKGLHPKTGKYREHEGHYGNLRYAVKRAIEEGIITEETGIRCVVPDSLPYFERDDVLFTRRTDLNEEEQKIVEDVFSRRVFY